MKTFLAVAIIISVFLAANTGKIAGVQPVIASPCSYTHSYKIGTVDPRFKLSEEEFRADVNKAAQVWNLLRGDELFSFDENGEITVNLVFDERQRLNNQIADLEGELKSGKSSLEEQITAYEKQTAEFKQKLSNLNSQIEYWNNRGGAPEQEYQRLISEQVTLQEEGKKLNDLARQLNLGANSYNAQVKTLNQTVSNFNQKLQLKPEEGIYIPKTNTIDVYFNISKDELVHTLAHEFGHALGVDHNQNPKSIMYPFTTDFITLTSEDTSSLDSVCQKWAVNNFYARRADQFLSQFRTSLRLE